MNFYGKNKQKKKKAVAALATLAVIAIIAGTFAWTSYTQWVKNHMQASGIEEGKVTIVEEFPTGKIDTEMIKKVSISNASNVDVFVRVSFEEMLHRLGDGADGKGYATMAAAGFPVVINPADYKSAGEGEQSTAGWRDITNLLTIDGAAPVKAVDATAGAEGSSGYKLYQKDDSYTIVYVKNMLKTDWPKEFNFNLSVGATSEKIPTYTGDFSDTAATGAQVAQKLNGTAFKQPNGTVNFVTGAVEGAVEFYGYGKELPANATQNDWAGSIINLLPANGTITTTKPVGAAHNVSSIDSRIKFVTGNDGQVPPKPNVSTVTPDPADADKKHSPWWYNETDGYFYYTKVLPANSTTSVNVLESIEFPKDAEGKLHSEFKVASYDLWLGMEAIPAYQSALVAASNGGVAGEVGTPTTSGSGWGLADTSATYKYFASISIPE